MRIAMKAATYAAMHLTVALAVAFALTHDWRAALAIGLIEPMVQTVFFTLHDRAWARADRRRAERAGAAAAVPGGATTLS